MQWFSIGGTEQPRTFSVLKRTKAQLLTKKKLAVKKPERKNLQNAKTGIK